MILHTVEGLDIGADPRNPWRGRRPSTSSGRRIVVIVLGVTLAGAFLGIAGLALAQGTWWHSYPTDQALDGESRARIAAIRDEVAASGAAPDAIALLDGSLNETDPSAVRIDLVAAQKALAAADDPRLAEALRELRAVIQTIRASDAVTTTNSYIAPTLEWP
jgi:hypothetical protein